LLGQDRRWKTKDQNESNGNRYNSDAKKVSSSAIQTKLVLEELIQQFQTILKECQSYYQKEYPELRLELKRVELDEPVQVWSEDDSQKVLQLLSVIPSGVISLSREVPGLVQTSNNLGIVSTDQSSLHVALMSRSDDDEELYEVTRKLVNLFCLATGHGSNKRINHEKGQKLEWSDLEITISDKVQGWKSNPKSDLAKKYVEVYSSLTDKPIRVEAIHAGLECGRLVAYYPQTEAISVGPELYDLHTTHERVRVSSVEEFWGVLQGVLKEL
jgi:dipeptidase D